LNIVPGNDRFEMDKTITNNYQKKAQGL